MLPEASPLAGGTIDRVRRVLELKRFSGFAELAPEDLVVLAERAEERFFPAGTKVFHEGTPVAGTHFILEGAIHARRRGRDLRVFTGREVVGGLATLTEDACGLDAVAREDTWTLELPATELTDVFEENWRILASVMRSIANEAVELRRTLGDHAGYPREVEAGAATVGRLDLVERLSFLRDDSPFEKGYIDSMADLAREAQQIRLAAGERLWEQGDRSGWHLRILSGIVRCEVDGGRQRFRFGVKDVVGAMDSAARLDRWYEARAETDVVALRVSTDRLLDLMEDHTDLALELLRGTAATIQVLLERHAEATVRVPGQPGGP